MAGADKKERAIDLVETNIPGVFIPRPRTAMEVWRDITSDGLKGLRPLYLKPKLSPQVGKTHILRMSEEPSHDASQDLASRNWAGFLMKGNWIGVSATWTVPTVRRPGTPPGKDGEWNSTSWIGIGGYLSSDVLQIGIQQYVDTNGKSWYQPWFEWFAPKQIGSPYYVDQVDIYNFSVAAGDQIACEVRYGDNGQGVRGGWVRMENVSTRRPRFEVFLAPPLGATLKGDSIEWILEAPNAGVPDTVLPDYTPVSFANVAGYEQDGPTKFDPKLGQCINIEYGGHSYTLVSLDARTITIQSVPSAIV
jgi:Peptidase A4 family